MQRKINYFWKHVRYLCFHRIPELNSENVCIVNKNKVNQIVKKFLADGPDKLQIVTDFDQTMTMHTYQDKSCDSCHGVLDNSSFLPEDFREKVGILRNYYAPIEFDPLIKAEKKIPKMEEWWSQVHELLGTLNFSRSIIHKMVAESSVRLRTGCDELFKTLDNSKIPILILSAGLGDILSEILTQQSTVYNNMKIVSNFMKFDQQDKMIGFHEEIIHTFNKNKCAIHKSGYFLNQRTNIILLGDSLGDLHLADGAKKDSTILKIGYLNDRVDESLELYKNSFDIVLIKTENVNLLNSIVKTTIKKTTNP